MSSMEEVAADGREQFEAWFRDAIAQMVVQCDLKMATYEACSARGVLYELGFSEEETGQVLRAIAARGFDYCLDSQIECSAGGGDRARRRPTQDVCYWGPDQLKSRLQFVR
jgi:hypothetical protein